MIEQTRSVWGRVCCLKLRLRTKSGPPKRVTVKGSHMKYCFIIIMGLLIFSMGCTRSNSSPSQENSSEQQQPAAAAPSPAEAPIADTPKARDLDESVRFFESRVEWPAFDIKHADKSVYAIESGSNDEGAWFEGKGFFRGTSEAFVRDMNDPMIMGPSNVTQALSRQNATDEPTKHHYDLHVEMDYVFTVAFDLTVDISVTADGIHYESHKTSGTSMIKRIDEIIEIQSLSDGWYSIAFQSRYDAVIVKEKETRAHFEELFAHWAGG